MRHGKDCTHLHYSICKALGIQTTDKWYTYMSKPVCEEGDVTVLWNQAVHTDREVTAKGPDIIKNKKRENMHTDKWGSTRSQKCCAKGSGKEVKIQEFMYRDTTNVETEMYDCTVPVIIGATGIVTRSLRKNKNLKTVPGKHSTDSLQKTAILGTSHIIQKVLQCEVEAWAVGITTDSREVPGRKGLGQETSISYNNNTGYYYILLLMPMHKTNIILT